MDGDQTEDHIGKNTCFALAKWFIPGTDHASNDEVQRNLRFKAQSVPESIILDGNRAWYTGIRR
jgi:hypothetical protein